LMVVDSAASLAAKSGELKVDTMVAMKAARKAVATAASKVVQ